ncbi:YlxR family protein [Halobacillus shinanisalinarum]|uniref:YlxR family protein n=1 Tax=Halobacillus shinanisalinarum TaxID=2932258 RepID=A0ABY4GZE0_9BACI|nr:YlxR family protein [Halobacillus shinanisalinarum]UOQ93254.1 YlxR family protein [Halobacillus shinanisalinarum]
MAQSRKIPLRKCVVTQEMKPKKQLIRVVRNKDGEVFVDVTGKKNGRGAYISKSLEVIALAEKQQVLNRHLNTKVDAAIYEELKTIVGASD